MTTQTIAFAILALAYFIVRWLNRTDMPKIKGLPEVPGVPIFGNLLQLGEHHAKVAGSWVKKYGPVFQVRLGNRVSVTNPINNPSLTSSSGLSLPTVSSPSESCGSTTNPPSSHDRNCTPFTALYRPLKVSPLARLRGTNLANCGGRLLRLL